MGVCVGRCVCVGGEVCVRVGGGCGRMKLPDDQPFYIVESLLPALCRNPPPPPPPPQFTPLHPPPPSCRSCCSRGLPLIPWLPGSLAWIEWGPQPSPEDCLVHSKRLGCVHFRRERSAVGGIKAHERSIGRGTGECGGEVVGGVGGGHQHDMPLDVQRLDAAVLRSGSGQHNTAEPRSTKPTTTDG